MSIKSIKNSKEYRSKEKLFFLELSIGGNSRILTKHYVNLSFVLEINVLSLLSFLIYRSEVDNTIVYSSATLRQYELAVKLAQKRYKTTQKRLLSLPNTRYLFKQLLCNGLLLNTGSKKTFLVNPNITFHKQYVKAEFYKNWCKKYNKAILADEWYNGLSEEWINHVKINSKKV